MMDCALAQPAQLHSSSLSRYLNPGEGSKMGRCIPVCAAQPCPLAASTSSNSASDIARHSNMSSASVCIKVAGNTLPPCWGQHSSAEAGVFFKLIATRRGAAHRRDRRWQGRWQWSTRKPGKSAQGEGTW